MRGIALSGVVSTMLLCATAFAQEVGDSVPLQSQGFRGYVSAKNPEQLVGLCRTLHFHQSCVIRVNEGGVGTLTIIAKDPHAQNNESLIVTYQRKKPQPDCSGTYTWHSRGGSSGTFGEDRICPSGTIFAIAPWYFAELQKDEKNYQDWKARTEAEAARMKVLLQGQPK